YYGRGAYGIGAAARAYFGREPAELTRLQGIFLAGVVQAPSIYDPASNCPEVRERMNVVIAAREDDGSLGAAEAARLQAEPLGALGGTCPP
ncbi:MAG TPA: transglycosylase domain-containing protein, partial [Deinococcales bacterium]|nr:transglycosylase domain-containing protein [Deinococcales bacterium]